MNIDGWLNKCNTIIMQCVYPFGSTEIQNGKIDLKSVNEFSFMRRDDWLQKGARVTNSLIDMTSLSFEVEYHESDQILKQELFDIIIQLMIDQKSPSINGAPRDAWNAW